MKLRVRNFFVLLALLAGFFQSAQAVVTFTITPSAISNTYSGTVTLQVTGLSNTETVVVQKYLDANTNGIVNGGDILWQQFQLKDGQASVFHDGAAAVTNFNVPGDTDGINGSINAKLYFGFDFAQLIVGKYLFVLSSPGGHFSPITNSFSVTNFPFAQTFTGNVVNSGTNVPNAIVMLFQPSGDGQNPKGGVVANNSGAYSIRAATGTYLLGALKNNYVADLAASPRVTLGAGATINTNVPMTNATQTISGRLVDTTNSSLGLPGLLVPLQNSAGSSSNGLLTITATDSSGNFTSPVRPNQWKISGDSAGLNTLGYLKPQNSTRVDTSTGSVAGITIAYPHATAVFYGTVKDSLNHPLAGVQLFAQDQNTFLYEADGVYTDTNGNYVAGALPGMWSVGVSSDGNPAFTNYIFSQTSGNANLVAGQAFQQNFTALLAPNHISGHVQFNGNPVSGVGVNASATIGGIGYNAHADTDSSGNYSLNVPNGDWGVNVNCCCGSDSLNNILNTSYQCPNNQSLTVNNNNGTANFTVQPGGGGAYQIFGQVSDNYGDPVVGVQVYADDFSGDVYSATTDNSGHYSVYVGAGDWDVSVDCSELNSLGYACLSDAYITGVISDVENDFSARFITTPTFPLITLHGFSDANNDGANPYGGLVLTGNTLYGTAASGGTNGNGTVFAVNTNITSFAVVHTFTALDVGTGTTNSDGANPQAGLILSSNTLYGTAAYGGTNGNGTVFAVSTNGSFRIVHTFTALDAGTETTNSDGANPVGGLILSGNTLYGTTYRGGTNGNGTLFAVNTNGAGFTVLHTFKALDVATGTTNSDGANPYAGLMLSGSTLYGMAMNGGSNGNGTVFAINTNGTGFTVLHSFTNGADGAFPTAGLIASSNILYGTAFGGSRGGGTVFAVSTNGTGFTVLHSFTGGDDGANPYAGLILSGNTLYGTVADFGSGGYGTVFSVTTNGAGFTVLHSFIGGSDGANPYAGLILSGNTLYGTTSGASDGGNGSVFGLSVVGVNAPRLAILRSGANLVLTWPTNASGFTLQSTTNLISPVVWITNTPAPVIVNGQNTVTNPFSGTKKFYRLSQ